MAISSVLVLSSGELGTAILHPLSQREERLSLSVLLRPSRIASSDPRKPTELDELRSQGMTFVVGNLIHNTEEQLRNIFTLFDLIIGCTGFVNGPGTQLKLTHAVLAAEVQFTSPDNSASTMMHWPRICT